MKKVSNKLNLKNKRYWMYNLLSVPDNFKIISKKKLACQSKTSPDIKRERSKTSLP
jgi:hypothetical protein